MIIIIHTEIKMNKIKVFRVIEMNMRIKINCQIGQKINLLVTQHQQYLLLNYFLSPDITRLSKFEG